MKHLKAVLPYLLVMAANFYLLPIAFLASNAAMPLMLIVMPIVSFLCALVFGVYQPYSIFYSLLIGILFLPSVFLFYNSSALVFAAGYAVVGLVGCGIGRWTANRNIYY